MRYLYIGFINSIHRTSHSLYHSFLRTDDLQEKNKLVRERRLAKKVAREQYSLRMSALYKLSVANHFRDHVFWLPINLDFRGYLDIPFPHIVRMSVSTDSAFVRHEKHLGHFLHRTLYL